VIGQLGLGDGGERVGIDDGSAEFSRDDVRVRRTTAGTGDTKSRLFGAFGFGMWMETYRTAKESGQ
jgi:hypothetical protein